MIGRGPDPGFCLLSRISPGCGEQNKALPAAGIDLSHVRTYETITREQIEEIEYELADPQFHDIVPQILDGLKIQSIADMPKSKFLIAIRRIREIKQLRTGK